MKPILCFMAALVSTGPAWAQDMMKSIPADAPLKWVDITALPKGAQGAVLIGDSSKTGDMVVVRSKLPPNYIVPPHTHPYSETITVINGSIGLGTGEKIDKTGPMARPGAVYANPAKHAHFVWTGDQEAIIQVQYIGPGGIEYVNPADDPRKK
jgi:quercetin dioxygenase-like cupin family protein